MHVHMTGSRRSAFGWRRALIGSVVVLSTLLLAACDTHDVSTTQPCPALSDKGAAALAKLGQTSARLDEQQLKCGE
jgi:hypothetical protein